MIFVCVCVLEIKRPVGQIVQSDKGILTVKKNHVGIFVLSQSSVTLSVVSNMLVDEMLQALSKSIINEIHVKYMLNQCVYSYTDTELSS